MGCGCAGSNQRQAITQNTRTGAAPPPQPAQQRTGLPGEPGYTWNGPTLPTPAK